MIYNTIIYCIISRHVEISFYILSNLFYNMSIFAMNASLAYFFTYVLGNLALLSVVSVVQLVALLPATILVGKLIRRFGKKNTYVAGLLIIGLFPLIRLINVTNIPLLMIATAVTGFASGLCMPLSYGIQADNTDYIELDMGQRAEGAISSLSSFVTKCAMGIGGAIPGYMLAAVHFDAAAATQPDAVRTVIIMCAIVVPAIGSLLGALVMKFGYPLDKADLEEQNRRIAEIRAEQQDM